MSANAGSRYNKRTSRDDLSTLDPNSPEYWEAVLKREGLGMQRGKGHLRYGWQPFDTNSRNGAVEDDYSEESKP